jgi:iron-sulfur cluster repair protein YtfE (RIC family)
MKITDAFLGEHGVFYAQFDHVEQLLERGPTLVEIQAASATIAAPLVRHAQLENDLLFTAVEDQFGPGGPMLVMRTEHDHIERTLEAVACADTVTQASVLLREAILEARDHFRKEEQIAFPLAESVLSNDRLSELGQSWAELRAVRITGVVRAS